jgi:hypothetical protein
MALAVGTLSIAHAQEIEPRAYSNAPIGVNFLIAGYAYTEGAVQLPQRWPHHDQRQAERRPAAELARGRYARVSR